VLAESHEDDGMESLRDAKAKVVEQFERDYIRSLLLCHGGNISRASKTAGKNRRAFWELIRKYGIDAQGFKPNHL
jgi:DNA-binding NtrC family response regulator